MKLSRRALLSTTGLAALAGKAGVHATSQDHATGRGRLAGLPSAFTSAERDRRWARVREMMRREQFDALLTPAGEGPEAAADSRYLTQQNGWVVFPLGGTPRLIADRRDDTHPEPWVTDVRVAGDGLWSPQLLDALRDAKLADARIGVGRLVASPRSLEGDVPFTTLDRLRESLPRARFVSATLPLLRVKLVRSREEIALLEQVTQASERGLAAMMAQARPGAWHKDVWLAMFTAMHEATGAPPQRLALRAGAEANTSTGGPMLERLAAGQIMNQEAAAQALGFMAQVNHSIAIGRAPSGWDSAAQYCLDVFHELVEWIRPGRRYMDLCALYAKRATARTPGLSPTWVLVHTCGLGDGPRMGAGRTETTDLVIEPAMVFTVKPRIVLEGVSPSVQFGDPVLVTDTGARRLGRRPLSAFTTGV